jgi:hypothetical protein
MEDSEKKLYGESKNKNFFIKDSIGVPHPYCITPKHLKGDSMYLNADTIKQAEKNFNAVCDICRKINRKEGKPILSFEEHKQALLIGCKKEINKNQELHDYLLKIKDLATEKGFIGFAFMKVEK